jgi:hypothetical protein
MKDILKIIYILYIIYYMGNSQSNVQVFTVDKDKRNAADSQTRIEIEVNAHLLQLPKDNIPYYKGNINVKSNGGEKRIRLGSNSFSYTSGDSHIIIDDYKYSVPDGLTDFLRDNVIKDTPHRRGGAWTVGGYKKSYKRKSYKRKSQRKKNKRSRNSLKIKNTKRKHKGNKFKKTNRKR